MRPICTYLICATPRSGSALLCEALTNTGMAGYRKEYFEALKATGLPRRPREYFTTLSNPDVTHLLGDYSPTGCATRSNLARNECDQLLVVLKGTLPVGIGLPVCISQASQYQR